MPAVVSVVLVLVAARRLLAGHIGKSSKKKYPESITGKEGTQDDQEIKYQGSRNLETVDTTCLRWAENGRHGAWERDTRTWV